MNSPAVKAFGDQRIAAGDHLLVVDLAACSGMDSTFMGTLAGIAARLSAIEGGTLQIADPGERNRRSLEDLGLDFLMQINPPAALWRGRADAIRGGLKPPEDAVLLGQVQRARHVLDAHRTLSGVNDRNAREFASVLDTLEGQLSTEAEPRDAASPD